MTTRHAHLSLLAVTLTLAACDDGLGLPPAEADLGARDGASTDAATRPTSALPACTREGSFGDALEVSAPSASAGRRLSAIWVENTRSADAMRLEGCVAARVEGVVGADGTFRAALLYDLTENFNYPSVSVWIDADGDGRCGAGDLGTSLEYFGWTAPGPNEDRVTKLAISPEHLIGAETNVPNGVNGSFCSLFDAGAAP